MVQAHNGSLESLDNPNTHESKFSEKVYAKADGYITSMDTLNLGMTLVYLQGGHQQIKGALDPTAGIYFYKKTGDQVNNGDVLLEYFCSNKNKIANGKLCFEESIQIQSEQPDSLELIYY